MMNDYTQYYTYMNNLNANPNSQMMDQNQFWAQNQMMPQNQMQNKTKSQNKIKNFKMNTSKNNDGLADPYTGFTRGNMFDNLYYEYKNYRPQELNPTNDKEYAMLLLQMYGFAAHDLGLYLDINPNDSNAIARRAEFINMYNEALANYENTYGPITQNSEMLEVTPWAWDSKKWPWEGTR